MSKQILKPTAALLTGLAVIGRLVPHLPNMTPLGASAIFGGAKLGRPWNYVWPIAVLFGTDIFLGFHSTMLYVYASFALSVWLGEAFLKKNQRLGRVALLGAINAVMFFLITNFGVWATPGIHQLYPKTLAGLLESYLMGLPFLRNMLIGDVVFAVGFFSLYAWAEKAAPVQAFDKKVSRWLA